VPIEQYMEPVDVTNVLPVVREMAVSDRYVLFLIEAWHLQMECC